MEWQIRVVFGLGRAEQPCELTARGATLRVGGSCGGLTDGSLTIPLLKRHVGSRRGEVSSRGRPDSTGSLLVPVACRG